MTEQLITLLTGPGGLLVAFIFALFTGMKKKWVFGWYAKELREDRDEWKQAALKSLTVGERVVTVHEKEQENVESVQGP